MIEVEMISKRKYSTWHLINWVRKYFRAYKKFLFLDLFFSMLAAVSSLIYPQVLKEVVDGNRIASDKIVMWCIVILVISSLVSSWCVYSSCLWGHSMGYCIETDIRRDLFAHIQKLPFSFFDKNKTGQLISRMTTDLKDIGDTSHHFIIEACGIILRASGAFIILLRTNAQLTIIIFSGFFVWVLINIYYSKAFHKFMLIARQNMGELSAGAENSLLGIKTVKAFSNEEKECQRFEGSSSIYLKSRLNLNVMVSRFAGGITLVDGILYSAVIIVGIFFIRAKYINGSDLVAYVSYVNMLVDSMAHFVETLEHMQEGLTSASRAKSILDEQPEQFGTNELAELRKVRGEIKLENVYFRYDDANEDVLMGIDIDVKAGEKVAIVGVSGIGKSTLCSLIPRFYDVSEGRILIDGVDIKTFTKESLRASIGVIQQDIYLFAGTIAENIAYAKENATLEEIIKAAKSAGADEFISKMEAGYETQVGERGSRLSGGQKQRISIARVFLKNAPILILDEVTSALDTKSELIVQNSLKNFCRGRTTISIAQRLSTIRDSDKIFVLDCGKVKESGTHEELLAQNGIYRQLYKIIN